MYVPPFNVVAVLSGIRSFIYAPLYLEEGEVIMILEKNELGIRTRNYVLSYWNA